MKRLLVNFEKPLFQETLRAENFWWKIMYHVNVVQKGLKFAGLYVKHVAHNSDKNTLSYN